MAHDLTPEQFRAWLGTSKERHEVFLEIARAGGIEPQYGPVTDDYGRQVVQITNEGELIYGWPEPMVGETITGVGDDVTNTTSVSHGGRSVTVTARQSRTAAPFRLVAAARAILGRGPNGPAQVSLCTASVVRYRAPRARGAGRPRARRQNGSQPRAPDDGADEPPPGDDVARRLDHIAERLRSNGRSIG